MSHKKGKQPSILTVVTRGTPEFLRFSISDQYLRYWTGDSWTAPKQEKDALVYRSCDEALCDTHKLLMIEYDGLPVYRFKAPIYIELFTAKPVPLREFKLWLYHATKLLVDSPKNENGPIAGSLGTCRIEYEEMEEMK